MDDLSLLLAHAGGRSLKGERWVYDPQAPGEMRACGPSRPVVLHRTPTHRAGGQASVLRASLPRLKRQDLRPVATAALRLQSALHVSPMIRRLSMRLQALTQADPALAAGLVRSYEIFYLELPKAWVLTADDPHRVADPHGVLGYWAETLEWHERTVHDVLAIDPSRPAWTLTEAVERCLPFLKALAICHDQHRLVHRDIDVWNMLCGDGTAPIVLTDWGAAVESHAPGMTLTATARGKRGMQPPELRGRRSGAAQWYNDSWNVGYALCQIFLGLDQHPVVRNQDDTDLPDLSSLPAPVRQVVRGLLAPDPTSRLRMAEAHAELKRWLSAEERRALDVSMRDLLAANDEMMRAAAASEVARRKAEKRAARQQQRAVRAQDARRFVSRHRVPLSIAAVAAVGLPVGWWLATSALTSERPAADVPVLAYAEDWDEANAATFAAWKKAGAEEKVGGAVHDGSSTARIEAVEYDPREEGWRVEFSVAARANASLPVGVEPIGCDYLQELTVDESLGLIRRVEDGGDGVWWTDSVSCKAGDGASVDVDAWFGPDADSSARDRLYFTAWAGQADRPDLDGKEFPDYLLGVLFTSVVEVDPNTAESVEVFAPFESQVPVEAKKRP